ncbi:unnamed protein product [Auanema sp. JU1783]|nr:unnamed protein product [Auanema sp. JU1783]
MTDKKTKCKIAIAQVGTVLFDFEATLAKFEQYVKEAKENSADLVLFPEAFIGGYPKFSDFGVVLGTRSAEGREDFEKYHSSAIQEFGPEFNRLRDIAKLYKITVVTGVIEKDQGTLYCSVFYFGPEGYLSKHQKLLPTAMERCVWGNGDSFFMKAVETDVGTIAAAICWENYMPLYRFYLYSQGVQIYLAPTVDDREVWLPTMRTIALEGRCFVVSACQFLKGSDYPADHKMRKLYKDNEVLIRGGSCAVDPLGNVLVEPDFSGEMLRYVDIDLSMIIKGKFDLDTVGHYNRPDIFQLHVKTRSHPLERGVVEEEEKMKD